MSYLSLKPHGSSIFKTIWRIANIIISWLIHISLSISVIQYILSELAIRHVLSISITIQSLSFSYMSRGLLSVILHSLSLSAIPHDLSKSTYHMTLSTIVHGLSLSAIPRGLSQWFYRSKHTQQLPIDAVIFFPQANVILKCEAQESEMKQQVFRIFIDYRRHQRKSVAIYNPSQVSLQQKPLFH
jgi:hypothetical protein